MIKTILVPTDGSVHARKAVMLGATIAEKFGARVVVLHVLMRSASHEAIMKALVQENLPTSGLNEVVAPPIDTGYIGMSAPVLPPIPSKTLLQLGERYLTAARGTLEGQGVREVKVLLEDGDTAEKILEAAKREGADFIVMGHRGQSAFREFIAGSVSAKVSHHAECTVVSVK